MFWQIEWGGPADEKEGRRWDRRAQESVAKVCGKRIEFVDLEENDEHECIFETRNR